MKIYKRILLSICIVLLLGLSGCSNNSNNTNDQEEQQPSDNLPLEEEYTLDLESNGGELKTQSVKIKKGESYSLPVIKKLGYIFDGWYYDAGFSEKCENTLILTENTKVYAKWIVKKADEYNLQELTSINKSALEIFRDYREIKGNLIYSANFGEVLLMCQNFGIAKEQFVGCLKDSATVYAFELKEAPQETYGNTNVVYRHIGSNIYVVDSYGFSYFLKNQIVEEDGVVYSSDETSLLLGRIKLTNINVVVNKKVSKIEQGAFTRSNLESIDLSNTNIKKISYYSFSNCLSLKQVVLPESLEEVGQYAFSNSSIEYVVFPSNVKKIASYAYYGCTKLKQIEFTGVVEEVGIAIFNGCSSLNKVKGMSNLKIIGDRMFYGCTSLKEVSLDGNVEKVVKLAFGACTGISNIYISSKVKEIDDTAFVGMTSLTAFEVEEDNQFFSSVDGVLFNKDQTLLITYPIASINEVYQMPNSVVKVSEGAFYLTNLKKINLSENLEIISKTCFYYNQQLESIAIPSKVLEIGEAAFVGCTKLKEIIFEEDAKLTNINKQAFYQCYALEKVILPKNLQKIDDAAFANCEKLTTIVIDEKITTIGKSVFEGNKNLKIFINITENDLKLPDNWNSGLPTYYKGAWELVDGLPTVIE